VKIGTRHGLSSTNVRPTRSDRHCRARCAKRSRYLGYAFSTFWYANRSRSAFTMHAFLARVTAHEPSRNEQKLDRVYVERTL
jgi:hypothetical protein